MTYPNPDPLAPPAEPVTLRSDHEAVVGSALGAPPAVFADAAGEPGRGLPPDLRVPWGWLELVWLLLFGVVSSIVLLSLGEYIGQTFFHVLPPDPHVGRDLNPGVVVISQAFWFAGVLAYLYVVVRMRSADSFWQAIGWRGLPGSEDARAGVVLRFLVGGAVLSIAVMLLGQLSRENGPLPIEKLFDSRRSALLLMALAILVAPVIEETIFRGFIYPLVARQFGVPVGIVATGLAFGLMHAAQLWGAPLQIALMVVVGIVLTWVRARTGTVAASCLVHLGYNSTLFLGFIIATGGLRHMPAGS